VCFEYMMLVYAYSCAVLFSCARFSVVRERERAGTSLAGLTGRIELYLATHGAYRVFAFEQLCTTAASGIGLVRRQGEKGGGGRRASKATR
jgi:hypothetical protein